MPMGLGLQLQTATQQIEKTEISYDQRRRIQMQRFKLTYASMAGTRGNIVPLTLFMTAE
jgi:hypothetical protein